MNWKRKRKKKQLNLMLMKKVANDNSLKHVLDFGGEGGE